MKRSNCALRKAIRVHSHRASITVQGATIPATGPGTRALPSIRKVTQYLKDHGIRPFCRMRTAIDMCCWFGSNLRGTTCYGNPNVWRYCSQQRRVGCPALRKWFSLAERRNLVGDAFYAHEERAEFRCPPIRFSAAVSGLIRRRYPRESESRRNLPEPSRGSRSGPSDQLAALSLRICESGIGACVSKRADCFAAGRPPRSALGRERSQIGRSSTFMEQGFDSLSLTQVGSPFARSSPPR